MTTLMSRPPSQYRSLAAGLLLLLLGQAARGQSPDYWSVSTRACPQVLGADPRPFLDAARLDSRGCMSRRDPAELQARAAGRPVIFLIHGSYVTAGAATAEGLRIRDHLADEGAVTCDAMIVAFHWPSHLAHANLVRDANDKARLAFVAGYHLARFLQGFPSGSRISMIGHSHGGLVVLAALHLLAGGILDDGEEATVLTEASPALRLRAVVIASASDRQWLGPGERLGEALSACEGLLSLYNPLDPVLFVHPFGRYSDRRRALGKAGMSRVDQERLGPLGARFCQRNIAMLLGIRHTFQGSTADPVIAQWIGAYTWASPE
jgi:Alpha/beta hydrolase family